MVKHPVILLVEDESSTRQGLCELLARRYQVLCAADGLSGAKLAIARRPDLILLDLTLPQLSGFSALEILLRDSATRQIPVVVVSGGQEEDLPALCLERGASDFICKPVHPREMFARIERCLREAEEKRRLETRAQTDALTGLANFGALHHRLAQEMTRAERYLFPLSVVIVDLDNLKKVNDQLGHDAGNQAIVAFANYLRSTLRQADFASRYGGDEFVILLPHQPENEAATFAERLRIGMRGVSALNFPSADLALRISAGVACYHPPDRTQTAPELLRIADAALYAAKRQGRNRTVVHPSGAVESELRSYSAPENTSAGAGQTS